MSDRSLWHAGIFPLVVFSRLKCFFLKSAIRVIAIAILGLTSVGSILSADVVFSNQTRILVTDWIACGLKWPRFWRLLEKQLNDCLSRKCMFIEDRVVDMRASEASHLVFVICGNHFLGGLP